MKYQSPATRLKIGDHVAITATFGLSTTSGEGRVTFNDPKSPYITVDGYQYRKYEVRPIYRLESLHPEFGWGLEAAQVATLEEAKAQFEATRENYRIGELRIKCPNGAIVPDRRYVGTWRR